MVRMKKYIVAFQGYQKVLADSFDDAKRLVEKDFKYIHPKMNVQVKSIEIEEEE